MKKTDLNVFYEMGQSLGYLIGTGTYGTGKEIAELAINLALPRQWVAAFIQQTEEFDRYLSDSRKAAHQLLDAINAIHSADRFRAGHPVTYDECVSLTNAKENFEKCFEQETRKLSVFTVTPKGTRDTSILLDSPVDDFTPEQQKILPAQFLSDLRQAARCLVFEAPTACAFHICRGTEAMILEYYRLLAKHPWALPKNKNWNSYIDHLKTLGAPAKITTRLGEIRDMDRNAYAHPDTNVTLEEAPILYSLCAGVNFYMAAEMVTL